MRLLTWNGQNSLSLTDPLHDDEIPPYAILSHTWGHDSEEVTFADLQRGLGYYLYKAGYKKIEFCGEQARQDGIEYFWVDTCCINKADFSELSEAITSMYRWYQNARKCYVYLADVETNQVDDCGIAQSPSQYLFRTSRWFTRGWTLQELLAPTVVEFFSRDMDFIGTKVILAEAISEITTIPIAVLRGTPVSQFLVQERIRWTQNRSTRKTEDKAYCLLGIFNVYMSLMYGEGDNALLRLQKAINEQHAADVASVLSDVSKPKASESRQRLRSVVVRDDDHLAEVGAKWSQKACWSDWDTSGDRHFRFFTDQEGEIKFFQWDSQTGACTIGCSPSSARLPKAEVRQFELQLGRARSSRNALFPATRPPEPPRFEHEDEKRLYEVEQAYDTIISGAERYIKADKQGFVLVPEGIRMNPKDVEGLSIRSGRFFSRGRVFSMISRDPDGRPNKLHSIGDGTIYAGSCVMIVLLHDHGDCSCLLVEPHEDRGVPIQMLSESERRTRATDQGNYDTTIRPFSVVPAPGQSLDSNLRIRFDVFCRVRYDTIVKNIGMIDSSEHSRLAFYTSLKLQ